LQLRSFACVLTIAALAACGGSQSSSSGGASPSPAESSAAASATEGGGPSASPAAVAAADASAAASAVASPAGTDQPTPAVSAAPSIAASASVAAATTAPTAGPLASVKFTDISGIFAETAIKQEAALGIFGSTSGKFNPYGTVSRGTYVEWLVKANNLYFADTPTSVIRLAEANSPPSFVDVPKSNPYFPYVQGMTDAGYVIGIDRKHFAPNRPLTREELVAIQVQRFKNGQVQNLSKATSPDAMSYVALADKNQISKPYWGAINTDQCTDCLWGGDNELHRIFGPAKLFHPQQLVTRADVAVAIQQIANRTAASALPH